MSADGFHHRFVAGDGSTATTLLLLHGTGGTEDDLLPLGPMLAPGAALLSPRGKVLENGMPRFFRRLAEGVFDEADLVRRANELADWVQASAERYGFDARNVIAAGFSNGANVAAAMLLLRPAVLRGAALIRAMVPLVPAELPALRGTPVYLAAGRVDPIVPAENTERLASLLRDAGARVTLDWQLAGHGLTKGDVEGARRWIGPLLAPAAGRAERVR